MAIKLLAASCRGTSHEKNDSDRQDRMQVTEIGAITLIAVADGVGSSERGADAADIAVHTATAVISTVLGGRGSRVVTRGEALERDLFCSPGEQMDAPRPPDVHWPGVLQAAIMTAAMAVADKAAASDMSVAEWGTTLSLVVIDDDNLVAAQVGDGYVVLCPHDAQPVLLAHRVDDLQDPSRVTAITSERAAAELVTATALIDEGDMLLVSTDGIAPVLLDRWIPPVVSDRFVDALRRRVAGTWTSRHLTDLLTSSTICDRTDDDKTVVLALRVSPTEADASGRVELQPIEWQGQDSMPTAEPVCPAPSDPDPATALSATDGASGGRHRGDANRLEGSADLPDEGEDGVSARSPWALLPHNLWRRN